MDRKVQLDAVGRDHVPQLRRRRQSSRSASAGCSAINRPLLCTEYMARGNGSTFEGSLPIAEEAQRRGVQLGIRRRQDADPSAVGFVAEALHRPRAAGLVPRSLPGRRVAIQRRGGRADPQADGTMTSSTGQHRGRNGARPLALGCSSLTNSSRERLRTRRPLRRQRLFVRRDGAAPGYARRDMSFLPVPLIARLFHRSLRQANARR